ncbi:MAG TPA: hypothetical protein VLA46_04220 [Saprospiraceae bacterium]|nr:hypothetical protein [Saprospiraceae bacterium]
MLYGKVKSWFDRIFNQQYRISNQRYLQVEFITNHRKQVLGTFSLAWIV